MMFNNKMFCVVNCHHHCSLPGYQAKIVAVLLLLRLGCSIGLALAQSTGPQDTSLHLASVQNYSFTSNEESEFNLNSFNDNPINSNRGAENENDEVDDEDSDDQLCPRNREEAVARGRTCLRKCNTDADCISSRKRCLCDGLCGWSCVRPDLNCDELTTLANGRVISSGNFFNSKILYECDQGYFMAGTRERICQGDSSWSDSAPVCKSRPLCGLPSNIPHAKHNEVENGQTDFELNATLTYECFNGYEVQGSTKAVCQFNNNSANWDGPDLRCIPISCGDPGEIEFGYRESTGNVFTARANYNCKDGYVLVGRAIRYCKSNGLWSGDLPTCQPIKCPQPEDPKNGRAFYDDGFTFQSNVTYQCKPGFQLFGPSNRTCQSNRQWSDIEPQCNIIDCGAPGVFPNGYIEIHSTTIGSVIQFFCFDGMIYSGEFNQSVCSQNGTWSPFPFPRCLAQCSVPKIDNGKVLDYPPLTRLTHGQSINVTCISNYELYPDETNIFCDNGTWSQLPRCVPARCKTLPSRPKNGIVIAPKTEHGLRALFRCRDGFRLEGTNLTWCHFGSWNISSPRCIEVYCPFPGFLEHGKVLLVGHMGFYDYRPYVRRVSNNKQIIYECDRGYHIVEGAPGATCVDGRWSPQELPICGLFSHPKLLRWNRSLRSRLPPNNDFERYSNETFNNQQMDAYVNNRWQHLHISESESNLPLQSNADTESVQSENVDDYGDSLPVAFSSSSLSLLSSIRHKRHQLKHQTSKIKSSCQSLPPKKSSMTITIYKMGHVPNQNGSIHNETNGTITSYPHGTRIKLICDDGFVLANLSRSIIKCAKGRWKPELPDCLPAPCITPSIENAKFYLYKPAPSRSRGHSHSAGHFSNHHHNHNHKSSSSGSNRQLPEPELLESGQPVSHNSQIRLFCDYGFEQINSSVATLHCSYGSWDSFTRVRCLPIPCVLPTIRNGRYLNSEFVPLHTKLEHGSILEQNYIDCNGGYRKRWPLETSKFIRCLFGTLEPELPVCVPINNEPILESSSLAGNKLKILLNTTNNEERIDDANSMIEFGSEISHETGLRSKLPKLLSPIIAEQLLDSNSNNNHSTSINQTNESNSKETHEPDHQTTPSSCRSPEKIENALRYFDQLLNQPKLTLIGIAQFTEGQTDSDRRIQDMPFEYDHGTEIIFRCVTYSNRWNSPQFNDDRPDLMGGDATHSNGWNYLKASDPIQTSGEKQQEMTQDEINGTPVRSTWVIRCENGNWIGRSFECRQDFVQDLNAEKELKESVLQAASSSSEAPNGPFQLEPNNQDSSNGASPSFIEQSLNRSCLVESTTPNNDSNVWIFLNDRQLTTRISVPTGTRIQIRCSDIGKYQLIGPRERLCLLNGKWSDEEPICLGLSQEFDYALEKAPTILFRHQLGPIAQTPDGKLMVYPGTILHLECLWKRKYGTPNWSWTHAGRPYHQYWTTESGRDSTLEYRLTIFHAQLDDSGTYTCQTPNFHSHSVEIKVKAVHCPELNLIDPRVRVISNGGDKMNSAIEFDCPQGTTLLGSRTIVCQSTGRWSNSTPSCVVTECADLDKMIENLVYQNSTQNLTQTGLGSDKLIKPAKIAIQNGKQNVGDSVQFACPKGYGLQGPHHELFCLDSGKWSGPIPYCQEVKCPAPAAPINGFMEGLKDPAAGLYFASDIVQYACEMGFMLTGNPISICQENGRWSGPIPECKPACTYPGLMHGSRLISEVKFYYQINETIRFECVDGYRLKGNSLIKCIASGRWSGSIPHCELIQSPSGTPLIE